MLPPHVCLYVEPLVERVLVVVDVEILYTIINLLILIVGFFVRQHILEMKKDVKDIKTQTNLTNGRVGVLENETMNHKSLLEKMGTKMDELWKGRAP